MSKKISWKINYKKGYGNSIAVEAETEEEAKKIALIEYRRRYGGDGILSNHHIEDVVESATSNE